MNNDRRKYQRLSIVDVPVLLCLDDSEVEGHISNISELGIGVSVDKDVDLTKLNIEIDSDIKVVFCDEVFYGDCKDKFVIMCDCTVKHVETVNNNLFLGGTIDDEDFRNYYKKQELVSC